MPQSREPSEYPRTLIDLGGVLIIPASPRAAPRRDPLAQHLLLHLAARRRRQRVFARERSAKAPRGASNFGSSLSRTWCSLRPALSERYHRSTPPLTRPHAAP